MKAKDPKSTRARRGPIFREPTQISDLVCGHDRSTRKARGERRNFGQAVAEAKALLEDAGKQLRLIVQDKAIMAETPLEAQSAIESAARSIVAVLCRLGSIASAKVPSIAFPGGPTRQQGQFLAFIHEYRMRNEAEVAPSHADVQRFFNLTAPSVNSMLIRLEKRGFIRRIPGKARAIEIIIKPDGIPPLDRPFKF
jgi:repressor LexA